MKRTNRWLGLLLSMTMLFGVSLVMPITVSATQSKSENFSTSYTLTGNHRDDIVAVAKAQYLKTKSQLGYTEGWCADFVCDCAKLAGIPNFPFNGVPSGLKSQLISRGGTWHSSSSNYSPQKGDIVFLSTFPSYSSGGGLDHVGIVTANGFNSNGTVATIEGNTSSSGGTELCVNTKNRKPMPASSNSSTTMYVIGYVTFTVTPSSPNPTPTYGSTNPDDYTYPDPDTTDTIYRTSPTMKGSSVAWVQAVLYQLGYSIEVDGSYGQNSETVIKQFQSDNGLEVDGRVGPATKRKLLELWNAKKVENSHTCDKNTSSYQASHPHYLVYKCSVCGKEQVDTTITQRMDSCNSCLPEKSTLTVSAGTSLDYTSFSWSVAGGADCYELIVYRNGEDTPLHWLYNLTSNNHTLQLLSGEYTAYVASINNDLIDSSCWWVYSDKVEFSVSDGGDFAPVVGTEYNGSRYELYNVRIPWYEAKAKCEELGGHLVVITSASENEAVGELVSQGGRHSYWTGMSDNDTEGMWVSVTGEVLSYENWMDGEPNNQNDEDYAVIRNVDGKTWNDAGDTYHNVLVGFICEYESDADEDVTEPSTGNEDEPIAPTEPSTNDEDKPTESTEPSTDDEDKPTEPTNPSTGDEDKPTEPTNPSTGDEDKPTEPTNPSTGDEDEPTNPVVTSLLGDANEDGKVNIKDATLIQKSIANLTELTETGEALADADLNTKINIKDATAIQKHIAGIETGYPIGKPKTK